MAKSLYDTLGIGEGSDLSQIKKAYKKLAKQYHPDLNKSPEAEEKFKEINAAYEVLSDPQKKAQYDQYGDNMFGGQSFHDFSQARGGMDLNDIINQMFSGGGFGGFGQGGFGGGFNQPNLDLEITLQVGFNDAVLGATRQINLEGNTFDVKIPAGINDGQKLRFKGKGRRHGGAVGDVYATVQVASSETYARDGDDLTCMVDVPLKVALFGGKVEVETLYKTIFLKVPQDTKQGQLLRLKAYGVVNPKTKERGSLYVRINIINPKIADLDQRLADMLLEQLPETITNN